MGPDFFCPGGWWLFPTIMPIIMLIVVVTVLSHIFGRGGFRLPGQGSQKPESALEILQKRYARGEITKEEFDQIRRDLGT